LIKKLLRNSKLPNWPNLRKKKNEKKNYRDARWSQTPPKWNKFLMVTKRILLKTDKAILSATRSKLKKLRRRILLQKRLMCLTLKLNMKCLSQSRSKNNQAKHLDSRVRKEPGHFSLQNIHLSNQFHPIRK
jgi:hypothetical protein